MKLDNGHIRCFLCDGLHEYIKTGGVIAFFCEFADGVIHFNFHSKEEIEKAKKEMAPFNWKTLLIQGFFGMKGIKNDYA